MADERFPTPTGPSPGASKIDPQTITDMARSLQETKDMAMRMWDFMAQFTQRQVIDATGEKYFIPVVELGKGAAVASPSLSLWDLEDVTTEADTSPRVAIIRPGTIRAGSNYDGGITLNDIASEFEVSSGYLLYLELDEADVFTDGVTEMTLKCEAPPAQFPHPYTYQNSPKELDTFIYPLWEFVATGSAPSDAITLDLPSDLTAVKLASPVNLRFIETIVQDPDSGEYVPVPDLVTATRTSTI